MNDTDGVKVSALATKYKYERPLSWRNDCIVITIGNGLLQRDPTWSASHQAINTGQQILFTFEAYSRALSTRLPFSSPINGQEGLAS